MPRKSVESSPHVDPSDAARSPRPGPAPRVGPPRVGFAWYTPAQWARLCRLAADAEALDESFKAWQASAERLEADLARRKIQVERVLVDVDAVAEWCGRRDRPLDSTARSEFVAQALQGRDVRPSEGVATSPPGATARPR